jgi:hypothetical protein
MNKYKNRDINTKTYKNKKNNHASKKKYHPLLNIIYARTNDP